MDPNGWVKLYRQILVSSSVRKLTPAQRWFFVGLLLIANRGTRNGRLRGCLAHEDGRAYTHRELAEWLDVGLGMVGKYLRRLVELGMLRRRSDGVYCIVNYGTYQAGTHVREANADVRETNSGVRQTNKSVRETNKSVREANKSVRETNTNHVRVTNTDATGSAPNDVREANSESEMPGTDNGSGHRNSVRDTNTMQRSAAGDHVRETNAYKEKNEEGGEGGEKVVEEEGCTLDRTLVRDLSASICGLLHLHQDNQPDGKLQEFVASLLDRYTPQEIRQAAEELQGKLHEDPERRLSQLAKAVAFVHSRLNGQREGEDPGSQAAEPVDRPPRWALTLAASLHAEEKPPAFILSTLRSQLQDDDLAEAALRQALGQDALREALGPRAPPA